MHSFKKTEKSKTVDMTEGPFLKKMIFFAIPLVLSGLLQSFYNAADLIVVGHFKGDVAVAAVGSTGALTNLTLGLFLGLSVGAGVAVAHHSGAKEMDEVKKVSHTSILLALILGVAIGIFGFFMSETFLKLMDTPEEVLPYSTLYMKILFLGSPASMIYNYASSMMRSAGDSKRPLIFLAISGIANVILNVILVALFDMGVDGVATATIVSQYLSAVMSMVYLLRTDGPLRINIRELRINPSKLKKILYTGVPSGLQTSLFSISNVLVQSSINSFGDQVVAGSSAGSSLESFVYVAMNAIYQVALTFIGQNVGAKKFKNVRRLTVYSLLIVFCIGLGCGGTVLLLRKPLVSLYVSTPEATQAAMARLYIIMPTYFLCGIMDVFCGALRALDRSVTAMVISLCGACGLRIVWILTVFKLYPTPECVYISYPVSWFVTSLFHLLFVVIAAKKYLRESREALNTSY